jgi:hypothetical protein
VQPEGGKGQDRPPLPPNSGKKGFWEHQIDTRRHLLFHQRRRPSTPPKRRFSGHYPIAFGPTRALSSVDPVALLKMARMKVGKQGKKRL